MNENCIVFYKKKKTYFSRTFCNQRTKRAFSFNFVQLLFHRILFSLEGKNKGGGERRKDFFFKQSIFNQHFKQHKSEKNNSFRSFDARCSANFSRSFKIEKKKKEEEEVCKDYCYLCTVFKRLKIMIRRMAMDSTCKCYHNTDKSLGSRGL